MLKTEIPSYDKSIFDRQRQKIFSGAIFQILFQDVFLAHRTENIFPGGNVLSWNKFIFHQVPIASRQLKKVLKSLNEQITIFHEVWSPIWSSHIQFSKKSFRPVVPFKIIHVSNKKFWTWHWSIHCWISDTQYHESHFVENFNPSHYFDYTKNERRFYTIIFVGHLQYS